MNVRSTIQWATPYSLGLVVALALAALAAYAILRFFSGRPIGPARRAGLLVIRLAILAILGLILINPVRVDETPGTIERPRVFYLLDASQSMAIGKRATRWEQSVRTIRDADRGRDPRLGAQVSLFRFGSRLAALDAGFLQPASGGASHGGAPGAALAAEPAVREEVLPAPTDPDTLLAASLEGLTNQFGQAPPQAVVVFSDGRARDPDRADVMARAYARMKVPIHVLPAGEPDVGGDVAIVSLVAPAQVRKSSKVAAHVFVRSYGYKGRRSDLKLVAAATPDKPEALLTHTPIVLEDGLRSYSLAFDSGEQDRHIEARIDLQPGEVSTSNNVFAADMAIDHTKIRVLYLEGATEQFIEQAVRSLLGRDTVRGAHSSLQEALLEDRDVDCTAVVAAGSAGDFAFAARADNSGPGFPEIASELFAYDVIILSNVPASALDAKHQAWVEEWVSRRGGGLLMAGGPNSFASGRWNITPIAKMLPVELGPAAADWAESAILLTPVTTGSIHPIWQITTDEAPNRALLGTLPRFFGSNHVGPTKPAAEVLAVAARPVPPGDAMPEIVVQSYGRGRTMVMTPAITRRWASEFTQSWGGPDARYYKKFWRNVVYWLSENSSTGRRRLLAETDKRLYRPGEPIVLRAQAFDEDAAPTLEYRVAVTVEPKSSDAVASESSPLRRPTPADGPQSEAAPAPYLPWSEEFTLAGQSAEKIYTATLPIADAKSIAAGTTLTQGLRFELTAYEHNTQVDSSSLEVRILDDPTEQQNPLPDHDLLWRIARDSGGSVLNGAKDLSAMIERLPRTTGPPEVKKTPAWSGWWLLSSLIALLTVEWIWRRSLGLA
jgi:uncharacterized membrane protein